jgi:hypothetical protein
MYTWLTALFLLTVNCPYAELTGKNDSPRPETTGTGEAIPMLWDTFHF